MSPGATTVHPGRAVAAPGWTPKAVAASGWWPALATGLVVASLLVASDVSVRDLVVFTVQTTLAVVLPGTVLWRATVPGSPRPFAVDVALGTGLGLAVQVLAYLPARAAGVPTAHLLVPVMVVAACLAAPGTRARVLARAERPPAWWSWATAAAISAVAAYCARTLWFPRPLTGAAPRAPYVDQPYHLALVGELRHHLPADVPFVAGDTLYYHWFVHAEVAATSWATGIEPVVLLERLSVLPMILAAVLGAAALTWVLSGSWTAAAAAPVALALSAGPLVPTPIAELFTTGVLFLSPTTTFAQALLPGLAVVVVHVLRSGAGDSRRVWFAVVVLTAVSAGAKGSTLPMLALALLATALLVRRRPVVLVVGMLVGVVVVCVVVAQTLVYGGGSQGVGIGLFGIGDQLATRVGVVASEDEVTSAARVALTTVWVLGWVSAVAGLAGLLLRERRRDPAAWLLLMFVGAGLGAVVVLASASGNQLYFPRVAPTLAVAGAAWGLSSLCAGRVRLVGVTGACLFGGLVLGVVVRARGADQYPLAPDTGFRELLAPLLVLAAVVGMLAVVAALLGVAGSSRGRVLVTVTVALSMGVGLATGVATTASWLGQPDSWRDGQVRPDSITGQIGPGGIEAARWLRAHSSPQDLVATNQHCRRAVSSTSIGRCDNRSFWISGYAERRVLVEGWAYSWRTGARAEETGLPSCCIPFWDQTRLQDNDRAISEPTAARVQHLRERYGVDWLFVSTVHGDGWQGLRGLATERHRSGDYVVFELDGSPVSGA